jgi:cytochrome d ubiquinol oxidase subunit I
LAAIEAHWDGSKPGALVLFAWPNAEEERNEFEISIPNGASLILTHDPQGLFPGLKDFAPEDRPPVWPVFFAFRIMVGLGLLMVAIGAIGGWLWWKGRLFTAGSFLNPMRHVWPLGFIAILAGWWITETGRQPWVVHGILRTADAISPVAYSAVAISLILFVVVYISVFTTGVYYINRLIEMGPAGASTETPEIPVSRRPISAARQAVRDAINPGK